MSNFWIQDAGGGVLGPVSLAALRDILRTGQMGSVVLCSRDGQTWFPVADFPELRPVIEPDAAERARQEHVEAARIRMLQHQWSALSPYEIFGVKPTESLTNCRRAFAALAKPYHPDALSGSAGAELRTATRDMFQFLSAKMAALTKAIEVAGPRFTPPPTPAVPGRTATPSPLDNLDDKIELKKTNMGFDIHFVLNDQSWPVFSSHKLVNLGTSGAFFPKRPILRLATRIELYVGFEPHVRKDSMKLRGVVVLEQTDAAHPPTGFGVQLHKVSKEDRDFLQRYVDAAQQRAKR